MGHKAKLLWRSSSIFYPNDLEAQVVTVS